MRGFERRWLLVSLLGGGYVCAPDQSMPDMKSENLKALWDTAKKLGRY